MAGIYIHIPFCQSRCIYCDFYSTLHLNKRKEYVQALYREMESRQFELSLRTRTYDTLYIGGGTPSTLPPHLLVELLNRTIEFFPLNEEAEVTIEANPDDVTPEWIKAIKSTSINRISMGTQTFDNNLLKLLHRRHSSAQAIQAVRMLQEAGYHNLSIDLIYGIPGQDKIIWESDVAQALALNVPHLSAYSLMYEEGTALTRLRDKGELHEMDEETSLWCYRHLCEKLQQAGYQHYEISNFAKPGYHSRHNSSYWQGFPYLGFGAGAHSYDGKRIRRWNQSDLHGYIQSCSSSFEAEELSDIDLYNEFVMTRLRTYKGLNLQELRQRFGSNMQTYCQEQAKPHLLRGNLLQEAQNLILSREGIFVSNQVMSDLFHEQ